MSNRQNSFGLWSLLAGWTLASSIGWAAGLAVGVLPTLMADEYTGLNTDRFLAYATLISVGLTTGVAQWRGFRARMWYNRCGTGRTRPARIHTLANRRLPFARPQARLCSIVLNGPTQCSP